MRICGTYDTEPPINQVLNLKLQTGIAADKTYGNHVGDGGLEPGIMAISRWRRDSSVRLGLCSQTHFSAYFCATAASLSSQTSILMSPPLGFVRARQ